MKIFKVFAIMFLLLILLICFLVAYAFKIEPAITVINSYQLNEGKDTSIKVVQLSDIQVSETYTIEDLNHLVDKVNELSPDMIVFTGDLFDNYALYKPTKEVIDSLSNLDATYGKYAIWGNRDYGGAAVRVYEDVLTNSGFTLLKNSGVNVEVSNGKKIFIGGLDDALLGNPDKDRMLKQMKHDYDYEMILIHEPDIADMLKDTSVDLILAGHSHGGQVQLPFIKTVSTALAEKYSDGFYTLNESNGMQLYVNTGIGTSRLPVRFMVPPEIAVFNIQL